MSFVGKILVVLQLVLSVLFMALAGVVYSAHMNWRDDSQTKQKRITELTSEKTERETELEATKRDFTAKLTAAEQKAAEAEATNRGLQQQLATLKKEAADLQVARKTATEQSSISGEESSARTDEAQNLRRNNQELTARLDAEFAARRKVEDQLHALELEYEGAKAKNKEHLAKISVLQQALEANGITSDVTELAGRASPPPKLDGEVRDVKPARRAGSAELVEVSLGSDDGLRKGHEMTVVRWGENGQRAKYLAKIVIVSTTPDRSVAEVIESSRNGVIQKGDHVSTRL